MLNVPGRKNKSYFNGSRSVLEKCASISKIIVCKYPCANAVFFCVCCWIVQNALSGWRQKRNEQACLVLWENEHCKNRKYAKKHCNSTVTSLTWCETPVLVTTWWAHSASSKNITIEYVYNEFTPEVSYWTALLMKEMNERRWFHVHIWIQRNRGERSWNVTFSSCLMKWILFFLIL